MRKFAGVVILFLSVSAYGQQNFASISFGACLPQGNYGLTGDLSSNGYAKPGGTIKFDAAYFPGSYIGIGGSFSFGSNFGIRDSLMQDMIDHVTENASSVIEIPSDAEIVYGSGFWNNISFFIGPHFSARLSQRLYLDARVLGGISILRPPDQELLISWPGNEIHSVVTNHQLAFGFTAGGGIRYELNDDLALKLGIDFNQARAKFDYNFDLFQGIAEDVPPLEASFLVRTLDLLVGLAYSF
ncbi:MAG: outer membrane beta-barrel protein [Bacteroidetes bacterium]|nr:outer membrane beta-barrel protein [Bacteroidota bacterium]